ncbi:MAG: hypothetical protein E6Q36_02260 [Chryseobacterium sp.]|nr:MAG: hypothetical protein E6Q36_02260 [Chryseobacterium sp.]
MISINSNTKSKNHHIMRKEIFDQVVSWAEKNIGKPHSHKVHKHFIAYTFLTVDESTHIETIKAHMKKLKDLKKKKEPSPKVEGYHYERSHIRLPLRYAINDYLSILYDLRDDRISVTELQAGYRFNEKKNSYYPIKRKTHRLSLSKKGLYQLINRMPSGYAPRHIFTTEVSGNAIIQDIAYVMMGLSFPTKLRVHNRYVNGAKDDWDIIFNKTGVRIPKALRECNPQEVLNVVEVMANPNELNTICQLLSVADKSKWSAYYKANLLINLISEYMFPQTNNVWDGIITQDKSYLIRDYISDLQTLGRKTFTLKMRSEARMRDEHRKMTVLRQLRGVKKIKVSPVYDPIITTLKEYLPTVEIIDNKNRLVEESEEQQHCVATYADRINRGECLIISLKDGAGKRYTGEINKRPPTVDPNRLGSSYYRYTLNQLQGWRNSGSPEIMRNFLIDVLSKVQVPEIAQVF